MQIYFIEEEDRTYAFLCCPISLCRRCSPPTTQHHFSHTANSECATWSLLALHCTPPPPWPGIKILTKLCKCGGRNYCINLHEIRLTHSNDASEWLVCARLSVHIATIQFFLLQVFSRKKKKCLTHFGAFTFQIKFYGIGFGMLRARSRACIKETINFTRLSVSRKHTHTHTHQKRTILCSFRLKFLQIFNSVDRNLIGDTRPNYHMHIWRVYEKASNDKMQVLWTHQQIIF